MVLALNVIQTNVERKLPSNGANFSFCYFNSFASENKQLFVPKLESASEREEKERKKQLVFSSFGANLQQKQHTHTHTQNSLKSSTFFRADIHKRFFCLLPCEAAYRLA